MRGYLLVEIALVVYCKAQKQGNLFPEQAATDPIVVFQQDYIVCVGCVFMNSYSLFMNSTVFLKKTTQNFVCGHIEEYPSILYNNAQTKNVPVKAPNLQQYFRPREKCEIFSAPEERNICEQGSHGRVKPSFCKCSLTASSVFLTVISRNPRIIRDIRFAELRFRKCTMGNDVSITQIFVEAIGRIFCIHSSPPPSVRNVFDT